MNVLPKVTELVIGRDVANATSPNWFVYLYYLPSKVAPIPWQAVENTDFGVRSGRL